MATFFSGCFRRRNKPLTMSNQIILPFYIYPQEGAWDPAYKV
jgi:hypothetical protein